MKNLQTEIIIDAPITLVWKNLMDFNQYPDWNPFIHITGQPKVGQQLENTIYLEGQKPQVFRPKVLEVVPEKAFRWEGHLFVKGLFDGEHYFQLDAIDENTTRFIHGENFRGILNGMILKMIGEQTKDGFEKMNNAIKKRCEAMNMDSSKIK